MLLNRGAGIGARDKTGATALHVAAQGGQTGAAALLVSNGANVDLVDVYEKTALLWAIEKGELSFECRFQHFFTKSFFQDTKL